MPVAAASAGAYRQYRARRASVAGGCTARHPYWFFASRIGRGWTQVVAGGNCRRSHGASGALARATDSMGLCVFARGTSTTPVLVVRAFPAGVGITEDPASGAANGLIAAYLAKAEPAGPFAHAYVVSQGREIGHDAELIVRMEGGEVWVGGRTHTVVCGTLGWAAA